MKSLQGKGKLTNYDSYKVDKFSKSIKINWKFKDAGNAILVDHRAPEEFADTIRASFEPEEFRELLLKAGAKRTNAIMAVKSMFESVKNVNT